MSGRLTELAKAFHEAGLPGHGATLQALQVDLDTIQRPQRRKKQRNVLKKTEKEVLGATHAEVGAYLIGLWGLPDRVFQTMLDHHSPLQAEKRDFGALTAVHVANAFDHDFKPGSAGDDEQQKRAAQHLDMQYLEELKAVDQLQNWRDTCLGPDA